MSYTTEIIKPGSHKITLVELDVPIILHNPINYSPGIWCYTLNPDFGEDGTVTVTDDDGLTGWFEYEGDVAYRRIGSLNVNGTLFSSQSSITDCIARNESYYYDSSTQHLTN